MRIYTTLALCLIGLQAAQAQLTLPYSGTDASATISSFQIIKSGSSGRANTLYVTNAANSSDALLVTTIGTGRAGYFQLNNSGSSNQALRADSNGTGASVFGLMTGTGRAGSFRIMNASSFGAALYALTDGLGPALQADASNLSRTAGLFYGRVLVTANSSDPAVQADNPGGYALQATGGYGLYANVNRWGVLAITNATTGPAYAIRGVNHSTEGNAMSCAAYGTTGSTYGFYGENASNAGTGIIGYCTNNTGITYGLKGNVVSAAGYAIYGVGKSAVTGTKSFQIDHPLNPEKEILNHYCSEAPEPVNFYEGNALSDAKGYAVIVLPDYFESINIDPKYSLTVIDDSDDFVLVKVTKEIKNNQFTIRTSKPRVKVSWRVDAIRNDRWVQKYGYQAEQPKTEQQQGKFIQPELYGQPAEKGIHYVAPSRTEVPSSQAPLLVASKSKR